MCRINKYELVAEKVCGYNVDYIDKRIRDSRDVANFMMMTLKTDRYPVERFSVFMLDSKLKIIGFFFLHGLELQHCQMLFGAALFAALDIGVPGSDHVPIEIVLQNAVRLLQYRLAVLLEDWLTNIVHCRFRRPFLAPADLRNDLFYSTTQRGVFAPL